MALTQAGVANDIASFFDSAAGEIAGKVVNAALPLLGTLNDAAAADPFAALKTQILNAVNNAAGADIAQAIADAVNGLNIAGISAAKTAAGGVDLTLQTSASNTIAPRDIDVGQSIGDFFDFTVNTGATVNAGLQATLSFDSNGNFSLADTGVPELTVDVVADFSVANLDANLGVAQVTVTDVSPATPEFTAQFGFDLSLGAGGFSVSPTLSAAVGLNLHFQTTNVLAGLLPDMRGDFVVQFGTSNGAFIAPTIDIANLQVDLGSYLGIAKNFFGDVADIFNATPFAQIIDIVTEPIPGVNDLANKFGLLGPPANFDPVGGLFGNGDGIVTIGDLAARANPSIEPDLDKFYQAVDIIQKISQLNAIGNAGYIDFGGGSLIGGATVPNVDPTQILADLKAELINLGIPADVINFLTEVDVNIGGLTAGQPQGNGFTFGLFENPGDALKILLTNTPVDLVKYDVPGYHADEQYGGFFPVLGPLGFLLEGRVQANVKFDVGYDTYGLISGNLFEGFFITTADETRPDINLGGSGAYYWDNPQYLAHLPIGALQTGLTGGAGVGFGGSSITVNANIRFGLYAYLEGADTDGKFRPVADGFDCIFDPVGGQADVSLNLTFAIGYGPFSLKKNISLASANLGDFTIFKCPPPSVTATPQAPGLATLMQPDLLLNVGSRANLRLIVDQHDNVAKQVVDANDPAREAYVIGLARDFGQAVNPLDNPPPVLVPGKLDIHAFGFTQRVDNPTVIKADFGDGDDQLVIQRDVAIDSDISGGAGFDVLIGGAGKDTLRGDDDADILSGNDGDDSLLGGLGDDQLSGGAGADYLDGGAGVDTVDYSGANLNLGIGVSVVVTPSGGFFGHGGEAEGDQLISIESLIGTDFADDLRAGFGVNTNLFFDGGRGNDIVIGGLGDDFLIGGQGADHLNGDAGFDGTTYITSWAAVNVDLARINQFGGDAQGDRLFNMEAVEGSIFGDVLAGNAANNTLVGNDGNDTLEGRGGVDDVSGGRGDDLVYAGADGDILNGGEGVDTLSYERFGGPVTVDLGRTQSGLLPTLFVAAAAPDNIVMVRPLINGVRGISTFENLIGTAFADSLAGDVESNRIEGRAGNDLIAGDGGFDTLIGGAGADALFGGGGFDWAFYDDSGVGVSVDLLANVGIGGTAQGDTFNSIENLLGSRFADNLHGDNFDNIIDPNISGAIVTEIVRGAGGTDTLRLDYSTVQADIGQGVVGGYDYSTGAGVFNRLTQNGGFLDSVDFDQIERLDIVGTRSSDGIAASTGDDRIVTGAGDDFIRSGNGADFVDAGSDNDFVIYNIRPSSIFSEGPDNFGYGLSVFLLKGGTGVDTLSIDLQGATENIFITGGTNDLEVGVNLRLLNGAAATGFERLADVRTGAGADWVQQSGVVSNRFSTNGAEDLILPGLGVDFIDGGSDFTEGREVVTGALPNNGFGTQVINGLAFAQNDGDLMVLDYSSLQGPGGVNSSVVQIPFDVVYLVIPVAGTSIVLSGSVTTNSGVYSTAQGDFNQFTGIERLIVTGSAQNDHLEGTDRSYYLGFNLPGLTGPEEQALLAANLRGDDILNGGGGNDVLIGKTGSDTLDGGDGDDILIGSSPDNLSITFDGDNPSEGADSSEIDVLTGGAGGDTFVLGITLDDGGVARSGYFYASYGAETLPDTNRAIITDFNPAEDKIQLSGSASLYTTQTINSGTPNVATLIYHNPQPGDPPQLIAELKGVSSFDLNAVYVVYSTPASPGVGGLGGLPMAAIAGAPPAAAATALELTAAETIAPLAANATSWVQQTGDVATLKSALDGASGGSGSTLILSGSAGSFGTFNGDPFGLGSGIILSTGNVADLPGVNTIDRDTGQPLSVPLVFTEVITATGNKLYRADLTGLDIQSITLNDSNSKVGGSGGAASGFDIDGIVISNTLLTSVNSSVDLNNQAILPRLNVLDYSNANLFYNPGTQRAPNSGIGYAPDLIGSVNGLVDNAFAQLGTFTSLGNASALVLGDGGSLGINLTQPLNTSVPVYLYIGEVGSLGSAESLTGLITASPNKIEPQGDLSTDLGAPGLGGDTASLTYTFTPGAGDTAFSLDVVLFSEELPEFDGAVNLTDIYSIKLNGVEIGVLSNGAQMSIQSLIYSGSGDLLLNPVGTGALADQIKADAYTKTLTLSGAVIPNAVNTLTIEVRDGRDAFLDSGILIKDGSFQTFKGAAFGFNLNGGQAEAGGPQLKIDVSLPAGFVLTQPVTITVDPDDSIDLGAGFGQPFVLTFTPGGPETQQLCVIAAPGADIDMDGLLRFVVESPDPAFDGLDLAPIAIDIIKPLEPAPMIIVQKTGPASVAEGLADLDFNFTITASSANAATDPVTITTIADSLFSSADNTALFAAALAAYQALPGNAGASSIVLNPGESISFSFNPTGLQLVDAATPYVNTVTVNGVDDDGVPATATASATINATNVDPSIAVDKSASVAIVQAGKTTVTYTYAVTNTSAAGAADPLTGVTLIDNNGTASGADDFAPLFIGGDADGDNALDFDETWIFESTRVLSLSPAQTLTNTVTASAFDNEGVSASDMDSASVSALSGPGVRTPGFWGNSIGRTYFDGKSGVSKTGPNFPPGELAPIGPAASTYLILGGDHDNVLETGELAVSLKDALALVNASAKQLQDARFVLLRDAIATELNIRAGNPATDGDPSTVDPQHLLDDAVAWLESFADLQNDAQNIITIAELTSATAVKTSSLLWQQPQGGLDHTGLQLHQLLDEFNNYGTVENVPFANDDSWLSQLSMTSNAALSPFGHSASAESYYLLP